MNSTTNPLKVWAPLARNVSARVNSEEIPMTPDSRKQGWWTTNAEFPAGTSYQFIVDGEGPMPDPRSNAQPEGIHGPSVVIDHAAFEWSDQSWTPPPWKDAIIYELHVGTFSAEGTFEAAVPHLDALLRLGVTHIELMPVAGFPGNHNWGYDCVSIYAPHRAYGGVDGLKRLVDACHAKGLSVILDVIYNHMGPDGNYLPSFGPYYSDKHHTPWGVAPNLDGKLCEEPRRFFIENALMWLRDYHVDGLRLDAIDKVTDDSEKHLLVELRESVDLLEAADGRQRVLIAEIAANDPVYVTPITEGGYGMTAQWSDDLHHSIRTIFTKEDDGYLCDYGTIGDLAKALRQGYVYDGCYSKHRGKPHGKSPARIPATSLLGYVQTHDQIGNRPHGDRFSHHPNAGLLQQKVAAALAFLSPFIPMIFMGEEWAASTPFQFFTDHEKPELAKAVSESRSKEFGTSGWDDSVPDPQDPRTFLNSKLNWDERSQPDHRCMLGWYTELIRIRKGHADFGPSEEKDAVIEHDPEGKWISMRRGNGYVVGSLTDETVTTGMPAPADRQVLLKAGLPTVAEGNKLAFEGVGVVVFLLDC
jgi:maltooligosyltrehalose trehalohydrolase